MRPSCTAPLRLLAVLTACAVTAASWPAGAGAIDEPGTPAVKRSWHEAISEGFQGEGDPAAAFAFDRVQYDVVERSVHGTTVVVAIHRAAPSTPSHSRAAARLVEIFKRAWDVVGGYPFDRYVIKVRGPGESSQFALSRGGVVFGPEDLRGPGAWEFLAHEMFHSFNGGLIEPVAPPAGDLFGPETWLVEGGTVYWSFRLLGQAVGQREFAAGMRYRVERYRALRRRGADGSVAALARRVGPGPPGAGGAAEEMLYARGMLLSYLLDLDLHRRGSSLDAVLARLYRTHGLSGRRWTEADLEAVVGRLGGPAVRRRLARLVRGDADLGALVGRRFRLLGND
jgi:predicted metalloprotease with PDZ domain